MNNEPNKTNNKKPKKERDEAKEYAREILMDGLDSGANPLDILDDISSVWDGDPTELLP